MRTIFRINIVIIVTPGIPGNYLLGTRECRVVSEKPRKKWSFGTINTQNTI